MMNGRARVIAVCGDISLQNFTLSQIVQCDRIFTVEWTIELLVALLRARLNSPEIHGQITPDRILINSQQPLDLQILPVDRLRADPEFSAPEILDGKQSPSSDIYSIGLIAIYLLTGTRPFQLFDYANHCWVWQDYWQPDLQPSRVNYPKLVAILDRAIDLDPNLRFSSVREMMMAVRDCAPYLPPPLPNWHCQHTLTGHQGLFAAIKTIAISPHLPLVATGSEDTTIRLWNIDTGTEIGMLTGHQKSVESIAFHPQRVGLLFSGDRAGKMKLWQVDPAEELSSIDTQQGKINCLAISPDGKLIVSGGSDKTIKIWYYGLGDERSIDYLVTLKAHQLAVNGIAFNPIEDEVKFASVSSDRRVILWGMESKTPLDILTAHTQAVKTLAFSLDGKLLATAGDDGLIIIWDVDCRKIVRTISAHRWTISSLSFMADGATLISASWDGNVKFWDVNSGVEIDCLSVHEAEVLAMKICEERQSIVTASRDCTGKIWRRGSIESRC
jgi:WD40 repeat protein